MLALIAVLPEYAVDLYYAYAAGTRPEYTAYAAANMTGANRLLVGVGWALVVLAFALGVRRLSTRGGRTTGGGPTRRDVRLTPLHRTELGFLALAAVLGFIPALTAEIGWYMSVSLIVIYALYLVQISRRRNEDVEEVTGVPDRLYLSGVYLPIGFSVLIARHRDLGRAMETVVRPR